MFTGAQVCLIEIGDNVDGDGVRESDGDGPCRPVTVSARAQLGAIEVDDDSGGDGVVELGAACPASSFKKRC